MKQTTADLLQQVHGGRTGHHGVRRTWLLLNQHFPAHKIPISFVRDFISECPVCQKVRLAHTDFLRGNYKTIMTDSKRRRIGVDLLTVTPPDALNRKYLAVFVVHGSKLVSLHPLQDPSALEVARACYTVFARYGVFQELASDAGREFMNDLLKQLTTWFGVTQKFALVERHESNGVEHTNQPIIRHLQALVCDNECLKTEWSSPENLSMVEFLLNSSVNSETGFSAFELHFGSEELTHFHLPTGLPSASQNPSDYLKKLNTNLEHLWSLSQKHHATVQAKRKAITKEELNQYSPGDLVLMRREDPKNRDK